MAASKAKAKKKAKVEDLGIADRTEQLFDREDIAEQLEDLYPLVVGGFDDKNEQAQTIARCYDVYNCVLNENQAYYGSSQIYLPIVKDAIEARVVRFCNSLFPKNDRYASVTSTDGTTPWDVISLLNYYVKRDELRARVGPALIRMGDITGQYCLTVDWNKRERHVTHRVQRSGMETEEGIELDGVDEYEDRIDETVDDAGPGVEILDPRDVLVLPATVSNVEDAEIVAVALRMSKGTVEKFVKRGIFDKKQAKILVRNFGSTGGRDQQPNPTAAAVNNAGVKTNSKGSKTALVYKVWRKLKISKDEIRWCVTYYAGADLVLGCTRNPYWNDRIDVISVPAKAQAGSHWGVSQIEGGVEKIAYAANDIVNEGFDSAQFALMPIVLTDPEKNPRAGSMVLAMAAIWEADPASTKFASFPPLWKDAFSLVADCKAQIQQSLSVNPSMMPQGTSSKKPTQAQVAQEQQVALESTADPVTILESGVFSQVLRWFHDLDYQYRDKGLLIKQFGPVGEYAAMEEVQPIQSGRRYDFRWIGSESFFSAQQIQQMVSGMNILRGLPPEVLNGRKIDLGPVIDKLVEATYGSLLGSQVLIDQRHQQSLPVEDENQMLNSGYVVHVSPADNDVEHIQGHMKAAAASGDPEQLFKAHIIMHMQQLSQKQQAQAQAMQPHGQPGAPGQPGMPGQPRPGAAPQPPRGGQQPPGAIHQDQMSDPGRMPR